MGRVREAGHVHADLGDDPFDADSRDFIQVGLPWSDTNAIRSRSARLRRLLDRRQSIRHRVLRGGSWRRR